MNHPVYPNAGPGALILVGHRIETTAGHTGTVLAVHFGGATIKLDIARAPYDVTPDQLRQIGPAERPALRRVAA